MEPEPLSGGGRQGSALVALAAIAAGTLLLFFLRSDPRAEMLLEVRPSADPPSGGLAAPMLTGSGPAFEVEVDLPAESYLRLFTVDSNFETRLLPLDETGSTELLARSRVGEESLGPWGASPGRDGVLCTHAILIASEEPVPEARVLEVVPDPLIQRGEELIPALIRLCEVLRDDHGWAAQWSPIDL